MDTRTHIEVRHGTLKGSDDMTQEQLAQLQAHISNEFGLLREALLGQIHTGNSNLHDNIQGQFDALNKLLGVPAAPAPVEPAPAPAAHT